jgi:hypothetical protein
MSGPKLSQTALYEILVSEFESIKNTKGEFNKILSQINAHLTRLEQLYNKPITVDIADMSQEHERIKTTLERGLYFPKWAVNIFLCLVLVLAISLFFNYSQYITNKEQLHYIRKANTYIEKLEEQLPKHKSKK